MDLQRPSQAPDGVSRTASGAVLRYSTFSTMTCSIASSTICGMSDDKVRENRLRRMAERQGYQLVKSRRRDPRAVDYGARWIVDPQTGDVVAGDERRGMSLDEIEAWLTSDRDDLPSRPAQAERP